MDDFIDFLLKFIGNFLAYFNTYLDNLIVCIFLFKNHKKLSGKKLFHFRLMSYLFNYFHIQSVSKYRYNSNKYFHSSNFVGSKISTYGFFIAILFYLKYKSKEYVIFDEIRICICGIIFRIFSFIFKIHWNRKTISFFKFCL